MLIQPNDKEPNQNIHSWKLKEDTLTLSEAPYKHGQLWLEFEKTVDGFTTNRISNFGVKGEKTYTLPLEFQKENKIVRIWVEFPEKMFEWVGN